MKPNIRVVLERSIEEGLRHGYNRAYKHVESPAVDSMVEAMENAIWLEIDTCFNFEEVQ